MALTTEFLRQGESGLPQCCGPATSYRNVAVLLYKGQMGSGAVFGAGLAVQEITPESAWMHHSWVILGNLGSLDRIREAGAVAEQAGTEAESGALREKFEEHLGREAFDSKIVNFVHMRDSPMQNGLTILAIVAPIGLFRAHRLVWPMTTCRGPVQCKACASGARD